MAIKDSVKHPVWLDSDCLTGNHLNFLAGHARWKREESLRRSPLSVIQLVFTVTYAQYDVSSISADLTMMYEQLDDVTSY